MSRCQTHRLPLNTTPPKPYSVANHRLSYILNKAHVRKGIAMKRLAKAMLVMVVALIFQAPPAMSARAATADFELVDSEGFYARVVNLWYRRDVPIGFHGEIANGSPGDQVWIENFFRNVVTRATIPPGSTSVNTSDITQGTFRACGKAHDRPDVFCTGYHTRP